MKLSIDSPTLSPSFAIGLRFAAVGLLAVLLAIPLGLVSCVADDRKEHYDSAVRKVADSFGREMRVAGPVLVIPLEQRATEDQEKRPRQLFVMPERLDMRIDSEHVTRRVGIFEIPALKAAVVADGGFPALDVDALATAHGPLDLDRAAVAFYISDSRGVLDAELQWNDREPPLQMGSALLRAAIADPAAGGTFALTVGLRGTGRLAAVPVGDHSTVTMTSSWPHPSFDGRFLPDTHDISDAGFNATWRTSRLARGFRSLEIAESYDFYIHNDLGFKLYDPVTLYVLVSRSMKYGVLFVVLTLVSVLCLELASGRRFHIVQYGVAGLGLVLFFLVLLALAEHIRFGWAYLGAAAVLTGMMGAYTRGVTRQWRITAMAVTMLGGLYGVLFVLLRLEDFALLAGVGVLLLALGMLMWVTRRLTPGARPPAPDAA